MPAGIIHEEADEDQDFFADKLERLHSRRSINTGSVGPQGMNLADSLVEEHNFFNGVSPANRSSAYRAPLPQTIAADEENEARQVESEQPPQSYAINQD